MVMATTSAAAAMTAMPMTTTTTTMAMATILIFFAWATAEATRADVTGGCLVGSLFLPFHNKKWHAARPPGASQQDPDGSPRRHR